MGLVLLISVIAFMFILFRKKNILNWITLVILLIPIIIIGVAIYGLFSGNLFTMYQTISAPITNILPIGNINDHIDLQVKNGIAFFNQGVTFMSQIPDPTGIEALTEAEKAGTTLRWVIGIIIVLLLGGLIALNIFFSPKNNKKRDN